MSEPPPRPPQDVKDVLKIEVYGCLGNGAYKSVWAAVKTETGLEVVVAAEYASPQQEIEHSIHDQLISSPLHPHIIGPPVGYETVERHLPKAHDPRRHKVGDRVLHATTGISGWSPS